MSTRPGASHSYTPGHSVHLSDYIRIIYKRRWTALLGLMVIFVPGAFTPLKTTPIYEATAVLEARDPSLDEDDFSMSQYRIWHNRTLAWRAVDALGLSKPSVEALRAPEPGWFERSIAWVSERIGAPPRIGKPHADETTAESQAIDGFLAGLHVEPVRNTRLVELKYRSGDPAFAAKAANAVAEQYRQQNPQLRNITIVDRAEAPRDPILPRTRGDLMMAFLGGCLLAVGLVLGFEYMDSRIKTPDDIRSHLGLTFLGIVPTAPTRNGESILIDTPMPQAFSDAIRAVRTSVIFSSADEGARAIVVTSTAPHEGKTSVASHLAVSLAQTDQRTLVIDADMRRPRMHQLFNRPQEPGLSNVLVGTALLRDAVRSSNVQNLWVMAAGHLPPNPAELLGSNRYIELMAELQEQYAWIVIDAPPVMAVTDAAVIAHTATGVMFVVGAEVTPRRNAMAAVEQLAGARAKFIGAVLNRVSVERRSSYYSPYYTQDNSRAYMRTPQSRQEADAFVNAGSDVDAPSVAAVPCIE